MLSSLSSVVVDASSTDTKPMIDNDFGHYVATAHRAGVVLGAKRCSFTASNAKNVVVAKANRLEVRSLSVRRAHEDDLRGDDASLPLALDLPVRGRVVVLLVVRHSSLNTDALFLYTDRHRYCLISYDPSSSANSVRTHASGSLRDGASRPAECGPVGAVDPSGACVVMHVYDGWAHVVPIVDGRGRHRSSSPSLLGEPTACRLEERTVLDLCFLEPREPRIDDDDDDNDGNDRASRRGGPDAALDDGDRKPPAKGRSGAAAPRRRALPELALLHQDSRGHRHVASRTVDVARGALVGGPAAARPAASNAAAARRPAERRGGGPPTDSPLRRSRVDGGSGRVIPCAGGGALVLGSSRVTHVDARDNRATSVAVERTCFTCCCECADDDDDASSARRRRRRRQRWLLGDDAGTLWSLALDRGDESTTLRCERFPDRIPVPSALAWLGGGRAFVGSHSGDSRLLVNLDALDDAPIVVAEEYVNLGPIVHMDLMPVATHDSPSSNDSSTHPQSQIVACCGSGLDGSIRVIRNGVGVEERAGIDLPGIKGVRSLRRRLDDAHDSFLLLSFLGETRLLGFGVDGSMEEVVLPGLESDAGTLWCGNVLSGGRDDVIVQVTERGVRSCSTHEGVLLSSWRPEDGTVVTVAGGDERGVVLALRGGVVVRLVPTADGTLIETGRRRMDREVSCVGLGPWTNDVEHDAMRVDGDDRADALADVVAVGLWDDNTVRLLALTNNNTEPPLRELLRIELGGDTQARSVVLATLGNDRLLLVGLGEGHLVAHSLRSTATTTAGPPSIIVASRKKVALGTHALSLTPFPHPSRDGDTCVLASGDRPTVVYASSSSSNPHDHGDDGAPSKLLFSGVHLTDAEQRPVVVHHAAPFRLAADDEDGRCLCLADEGALRIGSVDDLRKLHVRSRPLEGPMRVAHHAVGRCLAVGCVTSAGDRVRFLDEATLEEMDRYDLHDYETVLSVVSVPLRDTSVVVDDDDDEDASPLDQFVLVGTAYAYPDEDEPNRGRILLFRVTRDDRPVDPDDDADMRDASSAPPAAQLVTERSVTGGAYSITAFDDGAVLVSVNARTRLYRYRTTDGVAELWHQPGATHHGHILSLFLKSRPSAPRMAIVGDLLRSVSVVEYDPTTHALDEVARDFDAAWTTAVETLDDDRAIAAENWNNLFVTKRNTDPDASDEVRCRLETRGAYHLGEMVNVFCRGGLVPPSDAARRDGGGGGRTLFATVDGSVGVVLGLREEDFAFFRSLERAMARGVPSVGNFSHEEFRAYEADHRVRPQRGMVDGDLVESFLDLNRRDMERVVGMMNEESGGRRTMSGQRNGGEKAALVRSESSRMLGDEDEGGRREEGDDAIAMEEEEEEDAVLTLEEVVTKVEEISRLH